MYVMTIKAEDYDDINEGTNAKNAIEEDTDLPIFDVNPDTGLITTAVCCLDREKTPDYSLQIEATDGGGFKGTGTASIKVKDLNNMPPQFTKDEWFVEVEETDANFIKKPATKDEIRENIINYCDEGGGVNDMTAFDMKTLMIPIDPLPELVQHNAPRVLKRLYQFFVMIMQYVG
uniref:Cadherin domain-containing protein n=1 Tax=Anopheles coluzzii TaxID=1518534 RepID=A0A8W7P8D5_ANOCL